MSLNRKGRKRGKARKSEIQRVIDSNLETKEAFVTFNETVIQDVGRTPYNQALTNVAGGTGQTNRVGNQIRVQSVRLRAAITFPDSTNLVRVILYSPKQALSVMSGIDVFSLVDLDRFNIYHDKLYTGGAAGPVSSLIRISKRFWGRGRAVQFYGTAGTDWANAPLFLYVVGDSGAIADPLLTGHVRTFYKDG